MTIKFLVRRSLFLFLSMTMSSAYADSPIPSQFPDLTTFTISPSSLESYSPPQQISYNPAIAKLLRKPLAVEFNSQGIGEIEMTRVLLTKLDLTKKERYYIDFDPGASNDPVFAIVPEGSESVVGSIKADHLVLPGNGFIYALARTNKMFLERRKYYIQKNKLVESNQPFLYIGLESKAKKNFVLTLSPTSDETVASIRKDDKVFVVLNDGDKYLVRSTFGLLGWVRIEPFNQKSELIEGIFFAGD